MTELYLLTGFLGSGKSTLLKNFIRLFEGRSVQLIINDFGQEGVDGTLLAELGFGMDEIVGGSVFCACRIDEFEKALRTFVAQDTEVVVVEASGLSDPTGVRRLLSQTDRFPNIEYKGAVCVVDAVRFPKIYAKARMAVKQLAASDVALINKVDKATPDELKETRRLVEGQRPDMPVLETSYGKIDDGFLELLASSQHDDGQKAMLTADLTSRELYITLKDGISVGTLEKFLEMFIDQTYRIKGFVRTDEGMCVVDCAGNVPEIRPFGGHVDEDHVGKLVVLYGKGMHARKYLKQAMEWYHDEVVSVQ